jgi:hypothetical protein
MGNCAFRAAALRSGPSWLIPPSDLEVSRQLLLAALLLYACPAGSDDHSSAWAEGPPLAMEPCPPRKLVVTSPEGVCKLRRHASRR